MADTAISGNLLEAAGLDAARTRRLLAEALDGADDGELYLERRDSEVLLFDNGRLKEASFDTAQGFGLRAVADEAVGYAHSSEMSEAALKRAADAVAAVRRGYRGRFTDAPPRTNRRLYDDESPLATPGFDVKVRLLQEIDAYLRGRDPRVVQVTASLGGSHQLVEILRPDGTLVRDVRPLVRVNVSVVVERDGRRETGSHGLGRRAGARPPTRRSAGRSSTSIRSRPRPASSTSCSVPAGPASCCTRPSATASKATSTGRRPRPSRGSWAGAWPRRASRSWTTARSRAGAARSRWTTRAR